jgi:hypothetical protein
MTPGKYKKCSTGFTTCRRPPSWRRARRNSRRWNARFVTALITWAASWWGTICSTPWSRWLCNLQIASVIGREFTRRVVDQVTNTSYQTEVTLRTLKAAELVYEVYRLPEPSYVFKHALTREVAYHSLLTRRQQTLHRQIGQAIETAYADHLTEQSEVLAHHFVHAQVWYKALPHAAARRPEQARQAYAAARTVIGRVKASRKRLHAYLKSLTAFGSSKRPDEYGIIICVHGDHKRHGGSYGLTHSLYSCG